MRLTAVRQMHHTAGGVQRKAAAAGGGAGGQLPLLAEPAQTGLDPGFQHLVVEGFCSEIVPARLQRLYDGIAVVQAGDEQDRAGLPVAQPAPSGRGPAAWGFPSRSRSCCSIRAASPWTAAPGRVRSLPSGCPRCADRARRNKSRAPFCPHKKTRRHTGPLSPCMPARLYLYPGQAVSSAPIRWPYFFRYPSMFSL